MTRYRPWKRRLQAIAAAGQTRTLRPLVPTGPTRAMLGDREVLVAASNDYLGLAWHPEVRQAATGGGVGSSRLISGDRQVFHALEDALHDWLGRPALLFSSGYQANLAVFSTVVGKGDLVASDALNHASMIDGLRLSRANKVIVDHLSAKGIPPQTTLIAVEGLYSMDGDSPKLSTYPTDPWLCVDEAHALGCLGPDGRGVAAAQGVQPDIVVGTLGKALGCGGAFVMGPPALKELLIQAGRPFIYTTGPPEPLAHMTLAALGVLRREGDALREQLAANTQRLRQGLRQLGWQPLGSAHIVPVVLGPGTMAKSNALLAQGVLATGIRYPTVARGQERIRFAVSAGHTPADIDHILQAMGHRRDL